MSKLSFYAVAACVAATTFQLSAQTPVAALAAATVPNADVLFHSDNAKTRAAPIYKSLEEVGKKIQELAAKQDEDSAKIMKGFQELCEKEGFSSENLETTVFSASFGKLVSEIIKAAKAGDEPELKVDDISFLLAASVKKPVTTGNLKKIAAGMVALIPGDDKEMLDKIVTADFEHNGVSGMSLTFKLDADELKDSPFDKVPVFAVALAADGKVVFAGLDSQVKAAIDRAKAGSEAEASAELKKLVQSTLAGEPLNKRDVFGAFVMPQAFRDAMADLAKDMEDFPMPGVVPGIQAIKTLQGVRIAQAYGAKFDCSINLVLDSAETANSFKDVLQINVMNMAKMGLFQLTGKNTAFAESLAAVADGASTSINFSITAEDINLFFDLLKKKLEEPPAKPFFMGMDDDDDDE